VADPTIIQHPTEARFSPMTSIVKMLRSTFHPATGSVRAGEVVEVPHELGDHWTNNNIAEDATGQDVTRKTATEAPTGQDGPNEYGQWPAARALGEPDPAPAPGAGRFSAMTGRSNMGMAAPATTAEGQPTVAEPTSGPMTPENAERPPVPTTAEGQPTVAEPTSGPMTPANAEQPASNPDVPFTAEGTMHTEPEPSSAPQPAPEATPAP
jgi:hypothetical protein